MIIFTTKYQINVDKFSTNNYLAGTVKKIFINSFGIP